MSNPRISVSQLKQLIHLRANKMTTRSIARALSLSQGAVSKYGRAVLASCQTWEAALALEQRAAKRKTPASIAAAVGNFMIAPLRYVRTPGLYI